MLEVEIQKAFLSDTAPFDLQVSFRAEPGISVLFGPSGSGKSTILSSVAGIVNPDRGRIVVDGRSYFDTARRIRLPIAKRQVGYVFQDLVLFPHLTVAENVGYALGQWWLSRSKRAERRARVREYLLQLHVEHLARHYPPQLSGGQQQRVALARALIRRPRVLLLDEPLSGLDLPVKQEIFSDLRQNVARLHIPALYVTHDSQEAARMGERMLLLEKGRIVASGDPVTILKSPTRETVARLADAGNILQAQLIEKEEESYMQKVKAGNCSLRVPLSRHPVGARLRLAIPAGDILVATEKPGSISARNLLPGKVVGLESAGHQVNLKVDCGTTLEVRLTPRAVEELGIAAGKTVWLIIKAYSCHILEDG